MINVKNKNKVDDLYVHDTFISKIEVDYPNRKAAITMEGYKNRKYVLDVQELLLLECSYFNLWNSKDYKVLDIFLYEDNTENIICQKEKEENEKNHKKLGITQPYVKYEGEKDLIKVGIELDSGDILTFICNQLIFYNLSAEDALYDYN